MACPIFFINRADICHIPESHRWNDGWSCGYWVAMCNGSWNSRFGSDPCKRRKETKWLRVPCCKCFFLPPKLLSVHWWSPLAVKDPFVWLIVKLHVTLWQWTLNCVIHSFTPCRSTAARCTTISKPCPILYTACLLMPLDGNEQLISFPFLTQKSNSSITY